ncbi:myb-like protein X [Vespula maculifrons]|uniref:Myb-like protein X n=1 Tax=Vespula maculifrons TaxID=7453 RepID=A0ABD2CYM0_VESMC
MLPEDAIKQRVRFKVPISRFEKSSLSLTKRKKKFIEAVTMNIDEINTAMFSNLSFKWLYEETEYLLLKGSKWVLVRGYNRLCSERFVEGPSDVASGTLFKGESKWNGGRFILEKN